VQQDAMAFPSFFGFTHVYCFLAEPRDGVEKIVRAWNHSGPNGPKWLIYADGSGGNALRRLMSIGILANDVGNVTVKLYGE